MLRSFERVVVALGLSMILAACAGGSDAASSGETTTSVAQTSETEAPTPAKTVIKEFEVGESVHVDTRVDYDMSPPVGGDHNPTWAPCGFHEQPIDNEFVVHSMEHGAVWIAYRPDTVTADLDVLRGYLDDHEHVIITPYANLQTPVVVSGWGVQAEATGVNDPVIEEFIDTYEFGEFNAPEPGAPC